MKVLLFHDLRKLAETEQIELNLAGPLDEDALWQMILDVAPALAPFRGIARIARNQTYASAGETFQPDDEIALIPPVSGG